MRSIFCLMVAAALGGCDDGVELDVQDFAVADLAAPADLSGLSGDAAGVDDDLDGLDDRDELAWAQAYLPFISHAPNEDCAIGGLIVRVRPHPADATLVHILYDYLYNDDCGIGGHPGDDETFAITIDPKVPPPEGIIAMKAISHQGTLCQRDSSCGRCGGLAACQTLMKDGVPWPVVWSSRNKHGQYVNRNVSCAFGATCLDDCQDAIAPTVPRIVNVGEPAHPLVHDLTDQGFVTAANGWTHMELFHFDPWNPVEFGTAGVVASDLVDPAFDTVACRP